MNSTGMTDLTSLLKSMTPTLSSETFVFAQLPPSSPNLPEFFSRVQELNIKMLFHEQEAWTLILPKTIADQQNLDYIYPCRQITLNVHSSLDAVGFIAVISERLTKMNVGVNCVAAYYHDHLFIPVGKEDLVVKQLEAMAAEQI